MELGATLPCEVGASTSPLGEAFGLVWSIFSYQNALPSSLSGVMGVLGSVPGESGPLPMSGLPQTLKWFASVWHMRDLDVFIHH